MTLNSPKVVILDRDGVINEDSADYIKSAEEWKAIPGSLQAIAKLHQAGFKIAVATNQSGLGRGLFDVEALAAIHRKMLAEVCAAGGQLDAICFCPHTPDEGCDCRKPKPGLILQIAEQFACGTHNMLMVGDSQRDLQAAQAAGVTSVLVRTGNGKDTERKLAPDHCPPTFDDLVSFTNELLAENDR